MKEWLTNVKAPKFLRYLFFIAYSWYRRFTSERSDAHFTEILFLAMLHMLTRGYFILQHIGLKESIPSI